MPDAVISHRVDFKWHSDLEIDSKTFTMHVNQAYSEIVHWCQNLFMLPSGKDGQAFVFELARLIQAYSKGSALEAVALKCACILPALLLQKPNPKSKAHHHVNALNRRFNLWKEGNIMSLLQEGSVIQQRLRKSRSGGAEHKSLSKRFSDLMLRQNKVSH